MTIVEIPFSIDSRVFSEETAVRSPGLHLSAVLDVIETREAERKGKAGGYNKYLAPYMEQYRIFGFLWEHALRKQLEYTGLKLVRPGEFVVDGIAMSPDAIRVDDWVLEEWKCTWKSIRTPIEDMWRWWVQIKAYTRAIGSRKCCLRALHVNGDYSPPAPLWRMYERVFEPWELEENWEMILNNAKFVDMATVGGATDYGV